MAPPPPLRVAVPAHVEAAVCRALAGDPADRFATTAAFAAALESPPPGLPAPGTVTATLAVLPFANLSADPDNEFFSDGLTEEITAALAQLRPLRVTSRTSAMQFKGTTKGLPAIAGELGVRYVLEGSVRRAGESLRVTAQLIDATTDAHLWAGSFDGTLRDVFDVQEQVARAIVGALRVTLTPEESGELAGRAFRSVRAYERYLRARFELGRWTADGARRAMDYLREAESIEGESVLLDATFAETNLELSMTGASDVGAYLPTVETYARRILAREPGSPLGQMFLAMVRSKQRGGMREAVQRLRYAAERNPGHYATLFWLAFYGAQCGHPEIAEPAVRRLLEVDPLVGLTHATHGISCFFTGRPDDALAPLEKALGLAPESALFRFGYARVLADLGRVDEACDVLDRLVRDAPGEAFAWMAPFYAHALRRRREEALRAVTPEVEAVERKDETASWLMGEAFALIGEPERAVEWLSHAADYGFLNYPLLARDPFLASLRDDAGFRRLLDRVRDEWERLDATPTARPPPHDSRVGAPAAPP